MEDVMRHLQTDPAAKSELQAVLSECGDPGSRALLESVVREDGTTERQQFFEDQVKCGKFYKHMHVFSIKFCSVCSVWT